MKHSFFIILFFLIGLGIGVLINRAPAPVTITQTDTLTVVKTDTIKIVKPVYISKKVVDTTYINVNDTLFVPVPIEQRFYKGSNYEAYISGYKPNLDSIRVFNASTTKYITKEVKVQQRAKKWGIGAHIGYGYNGYKFTPYIGIGLQYNLIRF
jgi:hypothetical protein